MEYKCSQSGFGVSHRWADWSSKFPIDFLHSHWSIYSVLLKIHKTQHITHFSGSNGTIRSDHHKSNTSQSSILNPPGCWYLSINSECRQSGSPTNEQHDQIDFLHWNLPSTHPFSSKTTNFNFSKTHHKFPVLQSTTETFHKTDNFGLDQTRNQNREANQKCTAPQLHITSTGEYYFLSQQSIKRSNFETAQKTKK